MNSFRSLYKEEDIRQAYSYSYNNLFKKTLKTKMAYYNLNLDSKDLTNLDRLKDGLLDMKNNLVETVQTLHMREAELSHNVEKAEDLKIKTDELLINARKAKKIEKNRTPLKTIIPIVVGAVVVYCIFAIMCGGTRRAWPKVRRNRTMRHAGEQPSIRFPFPGPACILPWKQDSLSCSSSA